jgi:hypothetical protein
VPVGVTTLLNSRVTRPAGVTGARPRSAAAPRDHHPAAQALPRRFALPVPAGTYGGANSRTGRTSTLPWRADGIRAAGWIASFRSRASMR